MMNITLSEVVELYSEKCGNPHLTIYDVSGVNRDKEFFEPSKQVGDDTSNYQVVPPHYFACNLMHVGRDMVLPISQNHTDKNKYVSPAYTVFRIKENDFLLDDYLFMILKSKEKDRYFWFHTDSSVRDGMSWENFSSIEIPLPEIEVQREYVAVYKAMQHNLQTMQTKLDDLKLVCDGYIDQVKKTSPYISVGECVEIVDRSNKGQYIKRVCGVNIDKVIMPTNADTSNVDISRYKVLGKGNIVFSGMQTGRDNTIRMAIHTEDEPVVVSPAYTIFRIKSKKILSEYFMLWFLRKETDRRGWFLSDGSVRANLDMDRLFEDVQIPIPPIEVQRSIVAIYDVYNKRKQYAERLRQMINEICPILVAASVGNTAVAAAHS